MTSDTAPDDLLQLQIIQTLHCIIKSGSKVYLTNETMWHIIDFCVKTMTARTTNSAALEAAEKTMLDIIRYVFVPTPANLECVGLENPRKVGLPCALKVLGYFMGILQKHAAEPGKTANNPPRLVRSSSMSSKQSLALAADRDTDIAELILALKILHAVMLGDGSLDTCRTLLLECRPIASVLRDDLGKCLVLICAKRDYPIMVIQNILSLYGSLVTTLGCTIKIVIECFMKQIYLKALHQTLGMLSANDDALNGLVGYADLRLQGLSLPPSAPGFSIEELEVVFESLSDQIADVGFLPSIFASFDCDPGKSDIVIPVIRYLSHCARYFLAASSPQELGSLQEVASICMDCYYHILLVLSERSSSPQLQAGSLQTSHPSSAYIVSASMRATRQAKLVLEEAATMFVKKPELGLRFLQDKGLLPSPLTPSSVAKFLRIAPGLSKECTGAYLGELGKDSPQYEAEGKEFHRDVLLSYVQSFELTGQSILNSMRIFLSAFWLPGEAQQIDRILVAFSDYCHSTCNECISGILENSEVAYLLTFSIIMLNTDRHNLNIRHDRKMTMEQFVKNNTNYGPDLKQTKSLPREYLEEIYVSISEFPIRTERNDISGAVTSEMWMDLQLQAAICPEKGFMLTTNFQPAFLQKLSISFGLGDIAAKSALDPAWLGGMASQLLTSNKRVNPLALSAAVYDCAIAFDCDLVKCLWQELLGVGVCPFLVSRMPPRMPDRSQPERYRVRETSSRSLRIGIDVMVVLLRVGHAYSMQSLIDIVILLLAEFAGALRGQVLENLLATLSLEYDFVHPNRSIVISTSVSSLNASMDPCPKNSYRSVTMEEFVTNLMHSLPARAALGTLLQIVHNNPTYIGSSWPIVILTLGYLRDSSLLPRQMVADCDADLLPQMVRTEFEARLTAAERKKVVQNAIPKKSSSLLSFQGLGEAFFGAADTSKSDAHKLDNAIASGKWDAGYEEKDNSASTLESSNGEGVVDPESIMMKDITGKNLDIADYDTQTFAAAFGQLRELVSACGISSLISGTRFLTEASLVSLLASIVNLAIAHDSTPHASSAVTRQFASNGGSVSRDPLVALEGIISSVCSSDTPLPSLATCSWLEMVLVDISLRNRDRFAMLWPLLDAHYRKALGGSDAVSYLTERRIVGIFKIAERMIPRDALAAPLLGLMGHLFISPLQASFKTSASTITKPLSNRLLTEMSGQISAGMWRLLTTNVACLPLLGLEQWQVLFDIISMGASAGGYASIKAFEVHPSPDLLSFFSQSFLYSLALNIYVPSSTRFAGDGVVVA